MKTKTQINLARVVTHLHQLVPRCVCVMCPHVHVKVIVIRDGDNKEKKKDKKKSRQHKYVLSVQPQWQVWPAAMTSCAHTDDMRGG